MSEFDINAWAKEKFDVQDEDENGPMNLLIARVSFNKALELVEAEIAKIVRPHADSAKNIQDFINRLRGK